MKLFRVNLAYVCFLLMGIVLAVMVGLMALHIFVAGDEADSTGAQFSPASRVMQTGTREFTIALVSDTATNNRVLEKVMSDIAPADNGYAFVLYLGDLSKDYLADNYWMLQRVRPYLGGVPMWFTPGNHDVTRREDTNKLHWRNVFGESYYWFSYGDVLFISLDTSADVIDEEQFDWLEHTMEYVRPHFRRCVVFSHQPPIVPVNPDGKSFDHMMDEASARRLGRILRRHKIDAMFFGHVHYWSRGSFRGIPVYTLPSAGQVSRMESDGYGYVVVKFGRRAIESVTPKYVEFSGPVRDSKIAWIRNNIVPYKARRSVRWLSPVWASLMILGLMFASRRYQARRMRTGATES